MLILSRKVEQSIIINDHIIVKVLSVDRDTVKLGIDAPQEVIVNREEIQLDRDAAKRRGLPAVDLKSLSMGEQTGARGFINGHDKHACNESKNI